MKIKLLSFLMLVAITGTNLAVEGAGSPTRCESSLDDADSIVEAASQAVTTLSGIIKAKQSEALNISDTGIVAIDALNLQVANIRPSLLDRQTKRLENQAAKDAEFAQESAALRERMLNATSDFLRKVSALSDAQRSSEVISQVAKSREQALTLVNLINQNDRPGVSNHLQKNVAVTNLSVVDVRSDAGATVKFSVGRVINCLSAKTGCDSKTHAVTLNTTLIVPKSELSTLLELAVSKVRTLGELLKDLESIRELRDEYQLRLQAAADASQQAMETLSRLLKLLAESRAAITRTLSGGI